MTDLSGLPNYELKLHLPIHTYFNIAIVLDSDLDGIDQVGTLIIGEDGLGGDLLTTRYP